MGIASHQQGNSGDSRATAFGRDRPLMRERIWLDWNRPCLSAAVRWMLEPDRTNEADSGWSDRSDWLCVVPGRRARRLLLNELARVAADERLRLVPPTIVTPGAMVDILLGIEPIEATAEATMRWFALLRDQPSDELSAITQAIPAVEDIRGWYALATSIRRLHDELAGHLLTFADVARHVADSDVIGSDGRRWNALARLNRERRQLMPEDGHQRRLDALTRPSADHFARVVLIGVVEMNGLQRRVLDHQTADVSSLVHAPTDQADRFDAYGCVVSARWSKCSAPLRDDQMTVCADPAEQSQCVLHLLGDSGQPAHALTIGLGDPRLGTRLMRESTWAGIPLHDAAGLELSRTRPYRCMAAIASWLAEPRFVHFAGMLRQPDIEEWMHRHGDQGGGTDWVAFLDRYFADHLHERLVGKWLGDNKTREQMQRVYALVNELLKPLHGRRRKMHDWVDPILEVLSRIFETPASNAGRSDCERTDARVLNACEALRDVLVPLMSVGETQAISASTAIQIMLEEGRRQAVAVEAESGAIDMLGWLELPFDPASTLVIAGFNEGSIPGSGGIDPVLPERLRRDLRLPHGRDRDARDRYLFEAMVRSRNDVRVVLCREDSAGEPLLPSRLLLETSDDSMLARLRQFIGDDSTPAAWSRFRPAGLAAPGNRSEFVVPDIPDWLELPEAMSVTDFGQYLRCPYRYALSRLLKLRSVDTAERELNPASFGSVMHGVLEQFGRDEMISGSDDQAAIEAYVSDAMKDAVRVHYGDSPPVPVVVQAARMRQRLRGFAEHQAKLVREGWQIRHVEVEVQVELDIPQQSPMTLKGKMDRIDFHAGTGTWRIIDYKTGKKVGPVKKHHDQNKMPDVDAPQWHDLQLPLYRYLFRAIEPDATTNVELGYFLLPKEPSGTAISVAHWNDAQIRSAWECVRTIVKRIRARDFSINREFQSFFDEFSRICQTSSYADDEVASDA